MIPQIFVLCGIPGSGKTTIARRMSTDMVVDLYCADEFHTVHKAKPHDEISTLFHENIKKSLLQGKDVVCDGTYVTKFVRSCLLESIAGIPCRKTLLVMNTPTEECLRRNTERKIRVPNSVIKTFEKMYDPPTFSEGWDEIKEVTPNEIDFTSM